MNCEHIIMKRHGTADQCRNAARFFYHSTTGATVHLCGVHANSETHRWKKPMRILGTDQPDQEPK